jgi:hypothetical protein
MQVVLEHARRGNQGTVDALISDIQAHPPLNFLYTVKKSGKKVSVCSRNSIKRALSVCVELGFLRPDNGQLTSSGVRAANPEHFDRSLEKQLGEYLAGIKTPIDAISAVISSRLLRHIPPIVPTSENIWSAIGEPIPFDRFAGYLHLLGQCGVFAASQRRSYYPKK